jgi:uncharacterized membrane protein YhdT
LVVAHEKSDEGSEVAGYRSLEILPLWFEYAPISASLLVMRLTGCVVRLDGEIAVMA